MESTVMHETVAGLGEMLGLDPSRFSPAMKALATADHRYLRDMKMNLNAALSYQTLNKKESYLLALAAAVNERSALLTEAFTRLAQQEGATDADIAETKACVSLLTTNNVFYRFRHFTGKDFYKNTPAGMRMNIMMSPVLGKEFFELMSLAVSALNGCEMCVRSHEDSLIKIGTSEQRIYDAIRCVAIVGGVSVIA